MRRSEAQAAWLLWQRVRIPLNAWMFVSYVCCVVSWQRPLQRADKFVQRCSTSCVCLLWSRNLSTEVAWARVGLFRHVNKIQVSGHSNAPNAIPPRKDPLSPLHALEKGKISSSFRNRNRFLSRPPVVQPL